MKLAALGVTVLASTGDDGAPNQIQASSAAGAACACALDSSRLGHGGVGQGRLRWLRLL